jgi:hypothetical protein
MNSAKNGIPNFEVPPELRAMTEKSMEQARVAFNTFMTSAQQALSQFEGQAKAMQANAKDVSEKAMGFAKELGEAAAKLAMKSAPPKS